MAKHVFPKDYHPTLDLIATQQAIKTLKDCFQQQIRSALNLTRVSAPLLVSKESGLNDDLSGVERKVSFDLIESPGREVQIVQSLAKWKRDALGRYGYAPGSGLYTDMNAIRRDEETDNLHSVYVDQWDWEKVINREERREEVLKDAVMRIHAAILEAETVLHSRYPALMPRLPAEVAFITSEELYGRYPALSPEEREYAFVREQTAVFISHIGWPLPDGRPHGARAPDYDDWSLNGDLLYYHPETDCVLEMSSMGIRVDREAMFAQTAAAHCEERLELPFHRRVLSEALPLTMGGGIGQSRLCMLLLHKAHIGEVHCSVWPDEVKRLFEAHGVPLL